jgi:hypothetical protein
MRKRVCRKQEDSDATPEQAGSGGAGVEQVAPALGVGCAGLGAVKCLHELEPAERDHRDAEQPAEDRCVIDNRPLHARQQRRIE